MEGKREQVQVLKYTVYCITSGIKKEGVHTALDKQTKEQSFFDVGVFRY